MLRRNAHRPTQALTVFICLALGGCAAMGQGGGDSGVQAELAESRAQAEAEHARIIALEARLAQLEQAPVVNRNTQARVERLIEQNEVMLALANASCEKDSKVSEPIPTASFDEHEAADDAQRQQLARRLRAYLAGRAGGLSMEQREAMRVLLRPDRVLDRTDPWR